MVISQARPKRKASGGIYKDYRKKKLHEAGGLQINTKLGEKNIKVVKTIGKNTKSKILSGKKINLYDPKSKKNSSTEIKSILENPANRNFVRRNIITKGTIVETAQGKARVVSRPGQDGTLNAILI